MKKIAGVFLGLMLVFGAYAQDKTNGATITFKEDTHDFGDIQQGDKVQHVFTFENTGNEPLIITNVRVTCGCTAPQWPRDPIAPGQEGEITIQYNSTGKMGRQNKVITVESNAVNKDNKMTIITNILPKKTDTLN